MSATVVKATRRPSRRASILSATLSCVLPIPGRQRFDCLADDGQSKPCALDGRRDLVVGAKESGKQVRPGSFRHPESVVRHLDDDLVGPYLGTYDHPPSDIYYRGRVTTVGVLDRVGDVVDQTQLYRSRCHLNVRQIGRDLESDTSAFGTRAELARSLGGRCSESVVALLSLGLVDLRQFDQIIQDQPHPVRVSYDHARERVKPVRGESRQREKLSRPEGRPDSVPDLMRERSLERPKPLLALGDFRCRVPEELRRRRLLNDRDRLEVSVRTCRNRDRIRRWPSLFEVLFVTNEPGEEVEENAAQNLLLLLEFVLGEALREAECAKFQCTVHHRCLTANNTRRVFDEVRDVLDQ